MGFFKFYEKSVHYSNIMSQKLMEMIFLGKILSPGFQAKRGQNGLKMRFFKFFEKLALKPFPIFCIKIQ